MDESKSILLDAFADEFGTDIVFGRTTFKVNDTKSEKRCFQYLIAYYLKINFQSFL